ncbi:hypothetical protein Agabi119p4_7543 [Agaricus bisporus var. burnettii]|uniref:Uncharacterized protein n=1 Tax=Agaricus bisporus var. burnettii TaxID=192524 RepID=A0A8H7C8F4_AGABI|nr:hypothetical protein Agabi119p4_7543 [Agaricus bisporus var. burnettii]
MKSRRPCLTVMWLRQRFWCMTHFYFLVRKLSIFILVHSRASKSFMLSFDISLFSTLLFFCMSIRKRLYLPRYEYKLSSTSFDVLITQQVCKAATWITGFARQVAYTCVIKTLLVLRLRALYGKNNVKVTIVLGIAMIIEIISAVFMCLLTSISVQMYGVLDAPFPGCIIAFSPKVGDITKIGKVALWASKVFSNSVEVALTLAKLYQSLMNSNQTLLTSFERMRYWRPILYVFYRDGTLFFIPLFIISLFGLLESLRIIEIPTSWTLWLAFVYCIGGTRLILNLRIANSEVSRSSDENQLTSFNRLSTMNTLYTLQSSPQTYLSSRGVRPLARLY